MSRGRAGHGTVGSAGLGVGRMVILDRVLRAVPFLAVFVAGLWLWSVAESFAIATRLARAGPELWPKIVLTLLLGAVLWGVVEALFRAQRDDRAARVIMRYVSRSTGHEPDAEESLEGERRPIFAIAGIAAMLGYVAVLPYLGYAVSTLLLLLAIMLLAGYSRPLSALLIALLGTLAFFLVFQRIAYISLPLGIGVFKQFSTTLMALIGVR
jgi:putative tricarboxylic transport membrane protein